MRINRIILSVALLFVFIIIFTGCITTPAPQSTPEEKQMVQSQIAYQKNLTKILDSLLTHRKNEHWDEINNDGLKIIEISNIQYNYVKNLNATPKYEKLKSLFLSEIESNKQAGEIYDNISTICPSYDVNLCKLSLSSALDSLGTANNYLDLSLEEMKKLGW